MNHVKHILSLLVMTSLAIGTITAQNVKLPTLDDLISGGQTNRIVENIYGLQWWGDMLIKPGFDEATSINPKNGKQEVLFTRDAINEILSKDNLGRLSSLQSISFPDAQKKEILLNLRGKYVTVDFEKKQVTFVRAMKDGAANAEYVPASQNVAYTIDNNLYVNDKAVTNEPEGILCGQSVHRNEFGISKGTFWSPSGNLLAFYKMDERMVTEYPLVDITTRIATLTPVRYPMAGMTSHKVWVGVYNVSSGKTIYLDAGDPTDRYFTNISWSPDEKSVYLIELNRDQNHAKLCRYDAATGKLDKVLYEEKHEKYVEIENPITFLPWDDSKFILQSEKDGFNHLYLFSVDGTLIRQLTKGEWIVLGITGFNKSKKEIFFTSTEVSPLQTNSYKLSVDKGVKTPLDNGQGVHRILLSASGSYMTDTWSSPDVPRSINYVATTGKGKVQNLLTAEDPFKEFAMPSIEVGTTKAADGKTDLYYRITKPYNFDPAKKYPVIVYVYGGPHVQNITASFRYSTRGWDLYMANKGYILFTIDGRGSDNRGTEFENATFRHLGVEESKDQVKGVEMLTRLPYVDKDRIGVTGWSFGGHMTTSLMLRYPDIFKVGVAGGPVIDWAYYEVMYGERYMDTPQTNPEGYKESNLNNLAGNLKGHLLMIHGYQDETCVPQHSISFMKSCINAKVYPEFFLYPGHQHGVRGTDNMHLNTMMTEYFDKNL